MALIKKFQYGGTGYFIGPNPLIISRSVNSGTKKVAEGFNWLMGKLGKAFNTVLTSGASTDFGQTSPFTFSSGEQRRNVARARERTRLKANKAIEENSVYISPTSYVAAFTLGSLNPKVGAEVLSKDPRLQAIGTIGDLLTFKFGPKAVKSAPATVDKALATTGNKGAKGRVVAREMDEMTNEGLRTSPIERDRYYVNNGLLESFRDYEGTGSQMLESSFLDEKLNSGDPNTLVHFDRGDYKPNYWVYNLDGSKVKGAYVQEGKLMNPNENGLYWYPGKPFQDIHWEHKPYFRFNVPTRYISVNRNSGKFNDKYVKYTDDTRLLEVTSEGPVDLSNASVILKNPFGWWENVKYTTSSPQQVTHPWQLFNSRYSRFQLPNGKIRLLLSSHTEAAPRQFVLEPQGNNKYYVHTRTWDGDKVPANMSSVEKKTLFEALYNELPDGAEILLPQSGPGNYTTRGAIAGLLHLSRDSRFTPGTKGTLQYLDKDRKTIRTYEGTSFIKNPLNSYELAPVLRGTDYANYINTIKDKYVNQGARVEPINQSPTLTAITDRTGFVPMFLMWPGERLRAHAKEITRRLEQQGMDVDKQTANIPGVGEGTVREVINKNVNLPSYIGYFRKPGISGSYNKKTGITLVDPTEYDKTVTTMLHERNMHGTLRVLTDKMWKPYLDFLDNIFNNRDIYVREINNKKYYSVTDPDNVTLDFPITGAALRKEELRATLGLYRKDLYDLVAYPKAKAAGLDIKPDDLEGLRPFFELAVDELTIPLVKLDLHSINAYGRTYAKLGPKWNPNFLEELKQLLKYSPGVLPFMYNEEK